MRWSVLVRQTMAGARVLVVMTVLLGVAYPAAVWAVSRVPGLAGPAEGSVITVNGAPVGSSLIGVDPVAADPAADPWFHTRPSAGAQGPLGPGDPSTSGGSNQGGFNGDLVAAVEQRRAAIAAREGADPAAVPVDAVTASASGLDPHISPAYAALQLPRVARVTGLSPDRLAALVAEHTDGRGLGFLGAPGVNVTELNVAVAAARG
jgi:potassium-transporting ATPase KdpC subunit